MSVKMSELHFESTIHPKHLSDLEKLLYFNPDQQKYKSGIIECIKKYGEPTIIKEENYLTIKLSKDIDCESFFALYCETILIGVIIYTFDYQNKNIKVPYIAIDEKYSSEGILGDMSLALRMIDYLKHIAKSKNILTISLEYGTKIKTVIKV